jgi:hypothetical protein
MGFRICDSLQEFTLKGVLQELTLKGVALAGATRLRTVFVPMTLSAAFSLPILLPAGLSPTADRAGTFTSVTLSALGRPCCDSYAVAELSVENLTCAWRELRGGGRPVSEWRNSVPIEAISYTRALLMRLTSGVATLSSGEADSRLAFVGRLKGSLGSRIDGGRHQVAPSSAAA